MQQGLLKADGRKTSWKFLLLALFLLVQSLTASHEAAHIEQDVQDETCILCQNSDNNPLAFSASAAAELTVHLSTQVVAILAADVTFQLPAHLAIRAPPALFS